MHLESFDYVTTMIKTMVCGLVPLKVVFYEFEVDPCNFIEI